MEWFHHEHLYPFVDCVLTTEEKCKDLSPVLQEKRVFLTDTEDHIAAKLLSATSLYVYPDSFEDWTARLVSLHQHSPLPVKLMLVCDSDRSYCYGHFEQLFTTFPSCHFWIQNWLGVHPRATLLPLGISLPLPPHTACQKTSLLYISPVRVYPNCEARETFCAFVQETQERSSYIFPMLPFPEYCKRVQESLYHTCPMGNGPDTFRFWETLALQTIPVVKEDAFYQFLSYAYPEIPFVQLQDWTQLPECLSFDPRPIPPLPCLTKDYWISKLLSYKDPSP